MFQTGDFVRVKKSADFSFAGRVGMVEDVPSDLGEMNVYLVDLARPDDDSTEWVSVGEWDLEPSTREEYLKQR